MTLDHEGGGKSERQVAVDNDKKNIIEEVG